MFVLPQQSVCIWTSASVWSIRESMAQMQKLSSFVYLGDEMANQIWVCFSAISLGE